MANKTQTWYQKMGAKFLYCQRVDGGEWIVKTASKKLIHLDETSAFDNVSMGELNRSEIAIFRTRAFDNGKNPLYYEDLRPCENKPIPNALGMWVVNQADAGYF